MGGERVVEDRGLREREIERDRKRESERKRESGNRDI